MPQPLARLLLRVKRIVYQLRIQLVYLNPTGRVVGNVKFYRKRTQLLELNLINQNILLVSEVNI